MCALRHITQSSEEPVLNSLDLVAHEIGMSRRASAEQSAVRTAVRLASREQRLNRRLQRVTGQLAGGRLGR